MCRCTHIFVCAFSGLLDLIITLSEYVIFRLPKIFDNYYIYGKPLSDSSEFCTYMECNNMYVTCENTWCGVLPLSKS